MNWYVYMITALLGALFLMSIIAVFTSKSRRARIVIVLTFIASLAAVFCAPFGIIGRAKPVEWAWLERDVKEVELRGMELREGEGIYLMLIVNNEPLLYIYPWDSALAQSLTKATAAAEEQGTSTMIRNPFKNGGPMGSLRNLLGGKRGDQRRGGQRGGGRYTNSVETRDAPEAYPKPQEALPLKPLAPRGLEYRRNDDGDSNTEAGDTGGDTGGGDDGDPESYEGDPDSYDGDSEGYDGDPESYGDKPEN